MQNTGRRLQYIPSKTCKPHAVYQNGVCILPVDRSSGRFSCQVVCPLFQAGDSRRTKNKTKNAVDMASLQANVYKPLDAQLV